MIKVDAEEQTIEVDGSLPKLMLELYQIIKALCCEDKDLNKITNVLLEDIRNYNLLSGKKADEEKNVKRIAMLCVAQQVAEKNITIKNEKELEDCVNYVIKKMYE